MKTPAVQTLRPYTFRLSDHLRTDILTLARRTRITPSALVRTALVAFLETRHDDVP